ncbi:MULTISPECIES: hypothetical protein [unclassified Serratia (in: enterobacteria)]|uniref:hypothetical protein n=1 Tax=unclassified Serratia (in: enterobacteria) TaxID=2647522 RepID=UPI003B438645
MHKSLWIAGGVLACVLGVSGAQAASALVPAGTALNGLYGGGLESCLDDLTMLDAVNASRYTQLSTALDAEVARATHYLTLRDQLGGDIPPVMDKIYQARLAEQCQSIHNALFDGLLSQANGRGAAAVPRGAR